MPQMKPESRRVRPITMRRILTALLLAGGLLVSAQVPAYACKCAVAEVAQLFQRADVVVRAEVSDPEVRSTSTTRTFQLRVDTVFKGDAVPGRIEVTTANSSAACGVEGEAGTRRLWFLSSDYTANACDQPMPPIDAGALPDSIPDLQHPIKGTPPVALPAQPGHPAAPEGKPWLWGGLLAVALGVGLTGVVGFSALRRRVPQS